MSDPMVRLTHVIVAPGTSPICPRPDPPIALGPGLHALIGAPMPAMGWLAEIVAGLRPPEMGSGSVEVGGAEPWKDERTRRRIGATFFEPRLPAFLTVVSLVRQIERLRGRSAGRSVLPPHLMKKTLARLTLDERRQIELELALTTPSPNLLVLTDPLGTGFSPQRARADLVERIARQAADGCCVLALVPSLADAVELRCNVLLLDGGRVVRNIAGGEGSGVATECGFELRVECDLPRLLLGILAEDPDISALRYDAQNDSGVLFLRGRDVRRVPLALARAAIQGGATIRSITPVSPGIDQLRAGAGAAPSHTTSTPSPSLAPSQMPNGAAS